MKKIIVIFAMLISVSAYSQQTGFKSLFNFDASNRLVFGTSALTTTSTSQFQIKGVDDAGASNKTCITLGNSGYAVPSVAAAESNGDKFVFWNSATVKYSIGVEAGALYIQALSTGANSAAISFYSGFSGITNKLLSLQYITNFNTMQTNGDLPFYFNCGRGTDAGDAGLTSYWRMSGGAINGVTATDKAAGIAYVTSGISTGMGKSEYKLLRYTRAVSTATTDNSIIDAFIIPSQFHLTDGSAGIMFTDSVNTDSTAGGTFEYSIHAYKAAGGRQVETGTIQYASVKYNGVWTNTITEVTAVQALSSGSLASTWTITNTGTSSVNINCNTDSSLDPTAGNIWIEYNLHHTTNSFIIQK